MRKLTRAFTGTAATGAAIVAAIGLAAAPAFASVSSVTVSGSTGTGGAFTAATATGKGPTLKDNNTGVTLVCTSATASGKAPNGTFTAGAPTQIQVAELDSLGWSGCSISGIGFTVAANTTPWYLNATGPTVSGETTPGNITSVNAKLSGACIANVTGTVTGHYTNSTHTLSIDGGNLVVSGVSGLCLGLINNGDSVTYKADYVVTPALQVNAT